MLKNLSEKQKSTYNTMIKRVALYLIEEKLEPNPENMMVGFKAIIERDKQITKDKKIMSKIIAPIVWGKIKKQQIDEKVNQEINYNLGLKPLDPLYKK